MMGGGPLGKTHWYYDKRSSLGKGGGHRCSLCRMLDTNGSGAIPLQRSRIYPLFVTDTLG